MFPTASNENKILFSLQTLPSLYQENMCLVNSSDDMKHFLLFELNERNTLN